MKAKKRAGRKPQPLSKAMKNRICRDVALGKSLRKVLKAKGMPSRTKVHEELGSDPVFAHQYAHARRQNVEVHIDAIVELADTATDKNAHAVRLKVDVRKWLASKLVPRVYGDRADHDEFPHRDERRLTDIELARAVAFTLYAGLHAMKKPAPTPERLKLSAPPAPAPQPEPEPESRIKVINPWDEE